MRALQLALIALSVACLLSAITGVRSVRNTSETGGITMVTWDSTYQRVKLLAGAIVFAAGAWCFGRRTPLAWWLGWLIGVVTGADFISYVISNGMRQPDADFLTAVFLPAVAFSVVALYGAFRWYRQKDSFFHGEDAKV